MVGTFARIVFTLAFTEDGAAGEFPDELFGGDRDDADNAALADLTETCKRIVEDAFDGDEVVLGSVVFERSGPAGVVAIKTGHAELFLDELVTALQKVRDDAEEPVRKCAEEILRRNRDDVVDVSVSDSHMKLERDAATAPAATNPSVNRQILEGLIAAAVILVVGVGCVVVL